MFMSSRKKLGERGAIAFLTVLFIVIILTIVTTGFVRLMVREQRQSTDIQLSAQALYAAEAGVEDAVHVLREQINGASVTLNESICDPADTSPSSVSPQLNGDSEYTCQLIDLQPEDFIQGADSYKSILIPLNAVDSSGNPTSFGRININWHNNVDDGVVGFRPNSTSTPPTNLPPVSAWTFPAMVRAEVIRVPAGSFTRDDLYNNRQTVFLNPTNGGSGIINNPATVHASIVSAPCSSAGTHACSMQIRRPGGFNVADDYFLRLVLLYRPGEIRVALEDASGNPVDIEDAQALIDVTGRATDVFRRLQVRVRLEQGLDIFPPFIMATSDDVCKELIARDTVASVDSCLP